MKAEDSIGLLNKLNRFFPETILVLNVIDALHLFIHTYHRWSGSMDGTYKNYTSNIFVLQKKQHVQ